MAEIGERQLSPPKSSPTVVLEVAYEESSPSSPPPSQSIGSGNRKKLKKAPTITPRSFRRFFTPRLALGRVSKVSAARKALCDITSPAINRGGQTQGRGGIELEGFADIVTSGKENESPKMFPGRKRRRLLISPDTSPDHSPIKRPRVVPRDETIEKGVHSLEQEIPEEQKSVGEQDRDATAVRQVAFEQQKVAKPEEEQGEHVDSEDDNSDRSDMVTVPLPLRRARLSNSTGRALQRSLGAGRGVGFPGLAAHCGDWQDETAKFYSKPEDTHACTNNGSSEGVLPFSVASCNTNSLVAVGDEEGNIRLLESAKGGKPAFLEAYLTFRPHTNATLDITFSSNDMLLATASGDQTARIIDMPTQRVLSILSGHSSSIKQIRFQPGSGNDSVIATSSRDGSVQIWDLRCTGSQAPVRELHVSLDAGPLSFGSSTRGASKKMTWGCSVNAIYQAHTDKHAPIASQGATSNGTVSTDAPSKGELQSRRGDVSITALSFLPPGKEHLLLTASEANACVKLWDLRTTHNGRRGKATPLSSTRQPDSHTKHRHFGINSIVLSSDGGRLYTLCRDSTVYTYSTSHLILGHAPELSSASMPPRRSGGTVKEGLGPIYGFRHPQLHASTFYVKSALRPASIDKTELLAVGSSDGCAILFPTDERHLRNQDSQRRGEIPVSYGGTPLATPTTARPTLSRSISTIGLSVRPEDTIPIYQHGSALIRGHQREVTGLSWTAEGELVTVGDDLLARCWREGSDARDLRVGGESEGRRWGCGWAEVRGSFDDHE
ncbi:MAG: hypothetical protein M1836_003758 [Candelina mexicana]|nr:MAG: hypothetical protein M1836_003758 [Candelina mexicana]